MSIRGRTPSANDPSPELLREIRRVKMCRGYDGEALVWEERIIDPPPVWLYVRPLSEVPELLVHARGGTREVPRVELRFYRQGVEVDNRGTWLRYGLTPMQEIT